ncbi:hypothetical protein [Spirillospora sp. NPDC047279]|uniref:hypothetical protein n=1 Tax=Spirillospora sp. NPDC047279 TaxID=3155478 RepID=UPI0033D29CAF
MNPGATMPPTTDPEKAFQALKPAVLDELAEDAHRRRRADDLTRSLRAAPARARRRRTMPLVLAAGLTAAACATGGVIVAADRKDGSSG